MFDRKTAGELFSTNKHRSTEHEGLRLKGGSEARRIATALYAQAHGAIPAGRLRPFGLRSHRASAGPADNQTREMFPTNLKDPVALLYVEDNQVAWWQVASPSCHADRGAAFQGRLLSSPCDPWPMM